MGIHFFLMLISSIGFACFSEQVEATENKMRLNGLVHHEINQLQMSLLGKNTVLRATSFDRQAELAIKNPEKYPLLTLELLVKSKRTKAVQTLKLDWNELKKHITKSDALGARIGLTIQTITADAEGKAIRLKLQMDGLNNESNSRPFALECSASVEYKKWNDAKCEALNGESSVVKAELKQPTSPSAVESIQSKKTSHGWLRLQVHSNVWSSFIHSQPKARRLILVEYWDLDRTELFDSIQIEDKFVIDESAWEFHDDKNPLRTWSLYDLDDFFVNSFETTAHDAELMMTLFPSGVPRVINTKCSVLLNTNRLGPLNCVELKTN